MSNLDPLNKKEDEFKITDNEEKTDQFGNDDTETKRESMSMTSEHGVTPEEILGIKRANYIPIGV